MVRTIFFSAATLILTACAPLSPPPEVAPPGRAAAYAPLEAFVGRWTVKGREQAFTEVCAWYHGGFQIVCNSENRRTDGTLGRSMSIIGYSPERQLYTYLGIGSRGRKDGKTIVSRVRMGPFSTREVPFTPRLPSTEDPGWPSPRSPT